VRAQARLTVATARGRVAHARQLLAETHRRLADADRVRGDRSDVHGPRATAAQVVEWPSADSQFVFPFLHADGATLEALAPERRADALELLQLAERRHPAGRWHPPAEPPGDGYGVLILEGIVWRPGEDAGGEVEIWMPGDLVPAGRGASRGGHLRAETALRVAFVREHATALGLDRDPLRRAGAERARRGRARAEELRRVGALAAIEDRVLGGLRLFAAASRDSTARPRTPEGMTPRVLAALLGVTRAVARATVAGLIEGGAIVPHPGYAYELRR
jgi:hypothetical protein